MKIAIAGAGGLVGSALIPSLTGDGATIVRAPVVIFANAHQAARIANLEFAPTRSVRGQLTLLPAGSVPSLGMPVIGEGYAVPLREVARVNHAPSALRS